MISIIEIFIDFLLKNWTWTWTWFYLFQLSLFDFDLFIASVPSLCSSAFFMCDFPCFILFLLYFYLLSISTSHFNLYILLAFSSYLENVFFIFIQFLISDQVCDTYIHIFMCFFLSRWLFLSVSGHGSCTFLYGDQCFCT